MSNAFGGSSATCPGCNGNGRRSTSATLFRDVTKTKPSHHKPAGRAAAPAKATWPSTFEGIRLATETKESSLSDTVKARLIQEIIEYESSHGRCTETFTKKVRKQVRQ